MESVVLLNVYRALWKQMATQQDINDVKAALAGP